MWYDEGQARHFQLSDVLQDSTQANKHSVREINAPLEGFQGIESNLFEWSADFDGELDYMKFFLFDWLKFPLSY